MIKKIFVLSFAVLSVFVGCKNDDSSVTPTTNSNQAPNAPNNPTPPDNAAGIGRFVTLMWECTDPNAGDTLRFDVITGSSNPPTNMIASGILQKVYDLGLVAAQTKVYWRIVAKDNNGAYTNGPVWNFTTGN